VLIGKAVAAILGKSIDAMRDQSASMAAALSRQADAEMARLQLERERFEWQKERHAAADAERAQWRAQMAGDDLPAPITQTIAGLAGTDPALRAQLVGFARQRLARDITLEQVLGELRLGTNPKTL
jgi:hypothetical protein